MLYPYVKEKGATGYIVRGSPSLEKVENHGFGGQTIKKLSPPQSGYCIYTADRPLEICDQIQWQVDLIM